MPTQELGRFSVSFHKAVFESLNEFLAPETLTQKLKEEVTKYARWCLEELLNGESVEETISVFVETCVGERVVLFFTVPALEALHPHITSTTKIAAVGCAHVQLLKWLQSLNYSWDSAWPFIEAVVY